MEVKVAAVQPKSYRWKDEKKNLEKSLSYADAAAEKGAKIILFPEFYPGPSFEKPGAYDSTKALSEKAKEKGVYIIAGEVEKFGEKKYYGLGKLISPQGKVVGRYRRIHPPPRSLNVAYFDKHLTPGDGPLEVYKTEFGNLGILACSSVYWPELARVLALKGADIIFYPIGGVIYELYTTWKTLLWARAIENHVYTVATQNLYGMEEGLATIAGPEEILAETKREGVITATLDLDRLQWLREHEQALVLPKPYKTIPGLINQRRPEFYKPICQPKTKKA